MNNDKGRLGSMEMSIYAIKVVAFRQEKKKKKKKKKKQRVKLRHAFY